MRAILMLLALTFALFAVRAAISVRGASASRASTQRKQNARNQRVRETFHGDDRPWLRWFAFFNRTSRRMSAIGTKWRSRSSGREFHRYGLKIARSNGARQTGGGCRQWGHRRQFEPKETTVGIRIDVQIGDGFIKWLLSFIVPGCHRR